MAPTSHGSYACSMVEKQAVTIAYLIRAHFLPAQLGRLVDRLDSEHAAFFIHISAQTSVGTYAKMREAVGERERPVAGAGADPTPVSASCSRYSSGFARSPLPRPRATVILSGQDYPTRPTSEIETFLHQRPGESAVKHFALPAMNSGRMSTVGSTGSVLVLRAPPLQDTAASPPDPPPAIPRPAAVRGGSLCALSHDAVYRLSWRRNLVVRFFRHVKMPDEIFVPTVLELTVPRQRGRPGSPLRRLEPRRGAPKTLGIEDDQDHRVRQALRPQVRCPFRRGGPDMLDANL